MIRYCLLSLLLHISGPEPIDYIVAVVDKEVITASELAIEAQVALVLRHGAEALEANLTTDVYATFLDYLINQTLLSAQSRRADLANITDDDIDKRFIQFKRNFASEIAYQNFQTRTGITQQTIRNIFRRDLSNERLLYYHFNTSLDSNHTSIEEATQKWLDELRQSTEIRMMVADGQLETWRPKL